MDDVEHLITEVQRYDKSADANLIKKAYEFSKKAHEGQKRESGGDFFTHPVEVAKILIGLKADGPSICAGLLHDVIEAGKADLKQIEKEFGSEIAVLVDGLTKTTKIVYNTEEEYTAENLRKMLLATTRDIRVILIKLADRLHNMSTLKYLPEERRKAISKETLDIFAPIAHKLGMYSIKGELEDLAFRFLHPAEHEELKQKVNEKREDRERKAEMLINILKSKLKEENVEFVEISGRAKYFYSIYKKMLSENKTFEQIYDLIALRIIVNSVSDCYKAIAIVHQIWKPIQGRLKDYVAVPKSNGYQSLHTAVVTPFANVLEIQARTVDMDRVARHGVAAHWKYKGHERDKEFDKRIAWLEEILEWKRRTPHEFLEALKVDLFQDEIVVFTPKGDPIILPNGSTALDFAYAVHTNVGDHCVRAEVNKKVVSLDTELKGGDIINIVTSPKTIPSRNWLSIAKTSKAKQKIRNSLGIEGEERTPLKKDEGKIDLTKYISYDGKSSLKISGCCSPKFQDEIIAFKTKDGAVTIHKKNCANIINMDEKQKVTVKWNVPSKLIKTLFVYVDDEHGMVEKILDTLMDHKINVLSINMRPHKATVMITLLIKAENEDDLNQTKQILDKMQHVNTTRTEEVI